MVKRLALAIGLSRGPEQNREMVERVQVAEEAGVEAVFAGETWGRDQFSLLTQLALQTTRIKLATGITPVYGRSPAMIAQTAATLDELSGGRVILGLGTSGARVVEHWHGVPFERPLQRLKEYAEIINLVVSGEPVYYEGEIFTLKRGFKLLFEPVRKHIPIVLASISPKSMEQMGAFADGWMPIHWPKSRIRDGKATVAKGSLAAGRPVDAVECVASITTVVNPDPVAAKVQAAGPVSWYVTNMGDFYHRMLSRNGYAAEVAAMRAAGEAHKPRPFETTPELMAAMGDRMLEEVAVWGDIETVALGLDDWRRQGVDLPVIPMPQGTLREVERTLGALVG